MSNFNPPPQKHGEGILWRALPGTPRHPPPEVNSSLIWVVCHNFLETPPCPLPQPSSHPFSPFLFFPPLFFYFPGCLYLAVSDVQFVGVHATDCFRTQFHVLFGLCPSVPVPPSTEPRPSRPLDSLRRPAPAQPRHRGRQPGWVEAQSGHPPIVAMRAADPPSRFECFGDSQTPECMPTLGCPAWINTKKQE